MKHGFGETAVHLTLSELEAGLEAIRQSPKDDGRLELIVRRMGIGEREVVDEAELDLVGGLVGDSWKERGSSATLDGSAHRDMQIAVMNARVIGLLARTKDRWPLAGDQLFIDLDLSVENLPPGTRLAIGSAMIEVTAEPHTGCRSFMKRYGADAVQFVNSPLGRQLQLRGINAKVIEPGLVRVGCVAKRC
jgi:hypothetical protein